MKHVTFSHASERSLEDTNKDVNEYFRDAERVTDTLVQFLKNTVKDNVYHLGQHHRHHENEDASYTDKFEHQYHKIAKKVLGLQSQEAFLHELDGVYETMMSYLERPTSELLRHLFQKEVSYNTRTDEYRKLRWCVMIVMLAGLGTFLEYGHCINKCAEALVYFKDRDEIRFSYWGMAVPDFAKFCINQHRIIEDALGWDDLRDLDRLIQEVSAIARRGSKVCSLTFPTPVVPKHKVGPLEGTKSRIVSTTVENGNTYYRTRRGTRYTMNKDGLLQQV